MTVGAQHGDWTWDNLVAETGYDWSSYTSTGLGTQWRPRLTLATEHTGLKVGIRPVSSTGCQDFRLAPYVSCTATPVYWKIQVCVVTNSTVHSITVGINLTSPIFDSVTILTAPSTPDGEILTATGISGFGNNWLLLAEEAGKTTNRSCVVCMGPRPLLRIVPVVIPAACLLPVMKHDNPHPNCSSWDKVFPLVKASRRSPLFSSTVAKAEFMCVNMSRGPPDFGGVPLAWCNLTYNPNMAFKPVSRADVWWWCGGTHLYDGFPGNATGLCALVSLLLPISIYPVELQDLLTSMENEGGQSRAKRSLGSSSGDPTYIDAIGVPRGVPDEYKLVDQVAAGFESSICWWCTINKNIDRINYIHYNVQKLGNLTQQGFEAIHSQLSATSLMAYQNRIAVDMLLAEKGSVCSIFGEQCCTFIPNNTAPDGSFSLAVEGLRTLNGKMKRHSGVDTSMWDSWMDAFGKYKTLVSSILVSISVFVAILVLCGCCCIPCARTLANRLITTAISPNPADAALMYPLLDAADIDPVWIQDDPP